MDIQQYISSGVIETYLMGLCSPEEERELELLRKQYPELNRAITVCEEQLEKNMLQYNTDPGESTDSRILSKLDAMNTLKKPVPVIAAPKNHQNRFKLTAVAASVLLLLSAGLNYYQFRQAKNKPETVQNNGLPQRDYIVLTDPAITPVAMYGVGTHVICRCTMFWDKKNSRMYIMIHHLPKSSASRDYQLWAYVDGKPVSAGIIQDDIRGRFIELGNVPPEAISFSVTLEKAGGSTFPNISETYLEGRI